METGWEDREGMEVRLLIKHKIEEMELMSMTKNHRRKINCIPLKDPEYPPHTEYPGKKP
jgi:hypothetical protein